MKTRLTLTFAGFFIVLLCGVLYALPRDNHPAATSYATPAVPAPDVSGIDGAALYNRLCDKCHGLTEVTYGPKLTSLSSATDESLRTLILKGVPDTNMTPLEEPLTPAQLAALVKFVKGNALPKSPADMKALAIGPGAAGSQLALVLVPVNGGDLIARATLKDDKGAPLVKKPVVFNRVSGLGGRLPFATVDTDAQGLAVAYFPIKPGDELRIEAAFEGERGRQAAAASGDASLPGGAGIESLAEGLLSPSPSPGLVIMLGSIVGGIWLIFAYVVTLLARIHARHA